MRSEKAAQTFSQDVSFGGSLRSCRPQSAGVAAYTSVYLHAKSHILVGARVGFDRPHDSVRVFTRYLMTRAAIAIFPTLPFLPNAIV
jgi:hypothetical protein